MELGSLILKSCHFVLLSGENYMIVIVLTVIVFRGFYVYVVDLLSHMTNKALSLRWQWKGVLLNCLIHVLMTRFLPKSINFHFTLFCCKLDFHFKFCRDPSIPFLSVEIQLRFVILNSAMMANPCFWQPQTTTYMFLMHMEERR